jgi:hypothetical protein
MIDVKQITTQEALRSLDEWARGFDHSVNTLDWPLYECFRNGKRVGYFQIPNIPVIYPALHPDSSKRDVYEVCHTVATAVRGRFGCCSIVTPENTSFTPQILEHFGFDPRARKFYDSK